MSVNTLIHRARNLDGAGTRLADILRQIGYFGWNVNGNEPRDKRLAARTASIPLVEALDAVSKILTKDDRK